MEKKGHKQLGNKKKLSAGKIPAEDGRKKSEAARELNINPKKMTKKLIQQTVAFHGHECPGLWMGIRAAELCLQELGENSDNNPLVCIVETDMCGVDAIQVLTGCTFGKGNLIHRDYGKNAFTFLNSKTGKGFRAVAKPGVSKEKRAGEKKLSDKVKRGKASAGEREMFEELKKKRAGELLEAEIQELFTISRPQISLPNPPYILQSKKCKNCGEMTMESRVRLLEGKAYCIPCFGDLEQKS